LETVKEQLQTARDECSIATEEQARLVEKLAKVEAELDQARERLSATDHQRSIELQRAQEETQKAVVELAKTKQDLETSVQELEDKLTEVETQNTNRADEVSSLRRQLVEQSKALESAKASLRSSESETQSTVAELSKAKQDLETSIQELEAKLTEAESQNSNHAEEISTLQRRLAEQSEAIRLTAASTDVSDLQFSLDSARKSHEALTEELRKRSAEYATGVQQVKERAVATGEALESARSDLQTAREQYEAESAALNSRIKAIERETSEQLSRKDQELRELQAGEASMLERLHIADRDAAARLRECQVLRGLAAQKDEQISRLESDLRSTREEGEQLVQDFNALSHEYEVQQQEAETTYVGETIRDHLWASLADHRMSWKSIADGRAAGSAK
jgi:chromosome segregation ATPase